MITHVERVLDVQREDAPATKLAKLEQGLRPYRLPLDEVVPLFAALLSVPLDGRYAAPTLSPQQQKQQTLDALVAWMLEEAERQPVLVAWEDLHWADPSTLEMLEPGAGADAHGADAARAHLSPGVCAALADALAPDAASPSTAWSGRRSRR